MVIPYDGRYGRFFTGAGVADRDVAGATLRVPDGTDLFGLGAAILRVFAVCRLRCKRAPSPDKRDIPELHLASCHPAIRQVQELLGHAHVETTMIYLHVAKGLRAPPKSPLDLLE